MQPLFEAVSVLVGFRPSMAVPKQKQSHSRTNKRRSQHKITKQTVNECPRCSAPKLPHRVCGECGFYAGREAVETDA
jgi:large subunit ribosomal protein L32